MRIAVFGAGAGGTAVAFDCATQGHEVRLFDFPQFADNIAAIAAQEGVHADGDLVGFARIETASHDAARTLDGAELIYIVGPAYSTEPFGEALAGKLEAGQTVIVSPGSCGGALAFRHAAGLAPEDDNILVAETSTLPYAVRLTEPGRIRVFLKLRAGNLLAALPGLDHRYLNEDVGFGLVFMASLARQLGVATPTIDAVIHLTSVLMNRDYAAEAMRTTETLGLAGLDIGALARL